MARFIMKRLDFISTKPLLSKAILLWIIITVFSCNHKNKSSKTPPNSKVNRNSILSHFQLKSGDIVFRKGLSIESQAVLLADEDANYSHVGIVYIKNEQIYVIHITPDSLRETTDYAKLEKLQDFFAIENASRACVMRINPKYEQNAQNAADTAFLYYKNKVYFDEQYDLKSFGAMYCTEIVWHAYKANNINLIDINSDPKSIPFFKNRIIFPSSLYKCELLNKIYYF